MTLCVTDNYEAYYYCQLYTLVVMNTVECLDDLHFCIYILQKNVLILLFDWQFCCCVFGSGFSSVSEATPIHL